MKNVQILFVGGASASGKTGLASALRDALAEQKTVCKISMDNYYRDMPFDMGHTDFINRFNLDDPTSLDYHGLKCNLLSLIANQPAFIPKYDFIVSKRVGYTQQNPVEFIIVEGIFALHFFKTCFQNLQFNTTTIHVTVPYQQMMARRFVRNERDYKENKTMVKRNDQKKVGAAFFTYTAHAASQADFYIENVEATKLPDGKIDPSHFKTLIMPILEHCLSGIQVEKIMLRPYQDSRKFPRVEESRFPINSIATRDREIKRYYAKAIFNQVPLNVKFMEAIKLLWDFYTPQGNILPLLNLFCAYFFINMTQPYRLYNAWNDPNEDPAYVAALCIAIPITIYITYRFYLHAVNRLNMIVKDQKLSVSEIFNKYCDAGFDEVEVGAAITEIMKSSLRTPISRGEFFNKVEEFLVINRDEADPETPHLSLATRKVFHHENNLFEQYRLETEKKYAPLPLPEPEEISPGMKL